MLTKDPVYNLDRAGVEDLALLRITYAFGESVWLITLDITKA